MFKHAFLAFCLLLLPASASEEQDEINGDLLEVLFQSCQIPDNYCRDYISGVTDGLITGAGAGIASSGKFDPNMSDTINKALGFCLSDNVTTDETAKHVVSYMRRSFYGSTEMPVSPKHLVWLALRNAYPCK